MPPGSTVQPAIGKAALVAISTEKGWPGVPPSPLMITLFAAIPMLLGIAIYRWGFLTLQWSTSAYVRTAVIGYAVGLTAVTVSLHAEVHADVQQDS